MAIDTVNQLREHLLLVERALEDHLGAQARAEQLDNVQRTRERRLLAELAQQVDALARAVDASVGRTTALSEEIRRERDSRVPLARAIEELQRAQTAIQGRLQVVDEVTRRYSSVASSLEQAGNKRESDIARLDDHVKLLDLRVGRDLGEIRRASEEWIAATAEQLQQLGGLKARVVALGDARDEVAAELAETREQVARLASDLDRVDAQKRVESSEFGQIHEENEGLARRLEASTANIHALNDRIGQVDGGLDELRANVRALGQRLDELISRVARDEGEHARVEERVEALDTDLRNAEREARERDEAIARRFDDAIAVVRAWAIQHERRSTEHLRQIVSRLQDQLLELDSDRHVASESP